MIWGLILSELFLGFKLASAEVPQASAPTADMAGEAALLAAEGAHTASAAMYETLWRDHGDFEHLARAGIERARSGQFGHATNYLQAALAEALPAALAAEARAALQMALRACVPVWVELPVDPGGETIGVIARRLDPGRELPRIRTILVASASSVGAASAVLMLDPGKWAIAIVAGPRLLQEQEVVIQARVPARIAFAQTQAQPDAAAQRRRWLVATSSVGGVLAAAGIGLGIGGAIRLERPNWYYCSSSGGAAEDCQRDERLGVARLSGGMFLLGAGAGVLAGGLTGMIRDDARRRRAWIAESAVGGALGALGVVPLAVGVGLVREANERFAGQWSEEYYDEVRRGESLAPVGAVVLGVGLGMAVTAVSGLVRESRSKRRGRR